MPDATLMLMIRLPGDVAATNAAHGLSARDQRARTVRENVALEQLARALLLLDGKRGPVGQDVIAAFATWLRAMLAGPALPFNKEQAFVQDCLGSTDFVADAEIYLETLPGCDAGVIARNRADATKNNIYPAPTSPLRVRDELLRSRCVGMVAHFSSSKGIADETLKRRATEEFYTFYRETITVNRPPSYNSYTGMMACMGDATFMKQAEDIVNFSLGLTKEMPAAMKYLKNAPPPFHTMLVFASAMALCLWTLPSLSSVDEHATIAIFTTSIQGGPFSISPLALGIIRLTFAFACLATTGVQICNGIDMKVVRLPGSKLRGGYVSMKGWRTQGFYTSWAWNLLGVSFFLGGLIPLLVEFSGESIVANNPWLLRSALISFEIAAPSAFLTSSVVTYALWPRAYKEHGASGTEGFRGWVSLAQHNANAAMVLLEVTVLGGLPVISTHAALAPLFAGIYQVFLWVMAKYWAPKHGPVYPYFFMDTTLGYRTTMFMVLLMVVIGFFFVLFALLKRLLVMLEQHDLDLGAVPNVGCVLCLSYLLMKFKD